MKAAAVVYRHKPRSRLSITTGTTARELQVPVTIHARIRRTTALQERGIPIRGTTTAMAVLTITGQTHAVQVLLILHREAVQMQEPAQTRVQAPAAEEAETNP